MTYGEFFKFAVIKILTAMKLVLLILHVNWGKLVSNVSILYYIGAKDDGGGGDNCSSQIITTTNQHPTVYRPDALPVTQPTVSEH